MQSNADTNKEFWVNLAEGLARYIKRKRLVEGDWVASTEEIKKAFFCLNSRHRTVLELREGKGLSAIEVGKTLTISRQRASEIERIAYRAMFKSILAARAPIAWEDKPLLADKCNDFRSIDCVLRVFPSGLLVRLKKNNYKTMHQVCAATPRDLMEINGVGLVAVRKLEVSLLAYRQHNPQYFYD